MRQLSGSDTLMLYSDTPHAQNIIAPFGIYDPSTTPNGRLTYDDILSFVRSRLDIAESFRERIVMVPLGLDRPVWIRDPDFDLEYHVRHIALPAPGNWDQLCTQIARVGARPLDMTRPPWELYVIEGLDAVDDVPPGSFAVMLKMHHAAVDGVAGAEIVTALHDVSPEPEVRPAPPPWEPEQPPSNVELLARAGIHAVTRPLAFAGTVVPALRPRRGLFDRSQMSTMGFRQATRFNRPVSAHRSFGVTNLKLPDVKAVKNAFPGAKVNDVAIAVVGGALRAYLVDKGELPETSLEALMPISVRATQTQRALQPGEVEASAGGNRFRMSVVTLGTDLTDPAARMAAIMASTAAAKEQGAVDAPSLMDAAELLPGALMGSAQRAVVRAANRTDRTVGVHTIVTNVPGPQVPVFFDGARAVTMSGMAPVVDGMGLIHGIGSYGGIVPVCFTSDREMLPDPRFYERCIAEAFDELAIAAGTRKAPRRTKPRSAARTVRRSTTKGRESA
ncbi:MAG: wax ester/triacylglycerol synthase family O-acyltransferase [Ilumatobacteraceae bacterium]